MKYIYTQTILKINGIVYEILKNEKMRILKLILLYTATLAYLPFTLVRVVVASTLLVDLWCGKTINKFLKEVED